MTFRGVEKNPVKMISVLDVRFWAIPSMYRVTPLALQDWVRSCRAVYTSYPFLSYSPRKLER